MELGSPKIKKVVIFSQKNLFLCFTFLKDFLYFRRELFELAKKHSEKISYISGNVTF